MKITHIPSGKPYQLAPDSQLTVERTNPFFNDYGEQTIPVSLPDSEYNRSLLDYPDDVHRVNKMEMIDTSIQNGEYFTVCRQAILSVSPGESIDTSFYMNEGSFYSRLENTYLTDVFKDETVPGVETLDQAIDFMKLLLQQDHENFAVFPVEISQDRFINSYDISSGKFFAEDIRTEVVDDKTISVPRGFYLSPFIKVIYVLKRIFSYFGYTMVENFFTRTEQFSHLVFLNNVADAIVTGKIYLSQLLPDATCKDVLDLIRKKFLCEFITDEVHMTVNIMLMNEIIDSKADIDLSEALCGSLAVEYPETYKQIIIEAENSFSDTNEYDSFDIIKSKYPTAQFDPYTATFYRLGFSYHMFAGSVKETIGNASQKYYEGGNLESEKVQIPECFPIPKNLYLYVGDEQFLNSSLVSGDESSSDSSSEEDEKTTDMYFMMAFAFRSGTFVGGTITNYGKVILQEGYLKIGDYSLAYNGEYGIFEKFYRKYDDLLRNSLHTVKGEFLLSDKEKMNISSTAKVKVKGSDFFLNNLQFNIGSKKTLSDVELLSLQMYSPVSSAKTLNDIFPPLYDKYKWVIKEDILSISAPEYQDSPFKDVVLSNVYPPEPKAEYVGRRFFEKKTASQVLGAYYLFTYWLEVEAV